MAFKGAAQRWRKMTARVLKIVSKWYIAGTDVTATAAEVNRLGSVTPGTAAASKALVLGTNKNVDTLAIAEGGLKIGAGAGTAVSLTADQLNKANRQAVSVRVDQVTTGDMPEQVSLFTPFNTATLAKAYYIPDEDFSTTEDAFAFELINAGTDGDGTDSIAELDFSGAVANLEAHKPADFGALANAAVASLGAVALKVSKKGSTGADSKAGVIVLEYTI